MILTLRTDFCGKKGVFKKFKELEPYYPWIKQDLNRFNANSSIVT